MSKEEAKLYLRKWMPKLKIAFALFILFGIIVIIYTLNTGDFDIGTFLMVGIVIPIGFVLAICSVVLDIRSDEIAEKPGVIV